MIYVEDTESPSGKVKAYRMIADTSDELFQMAKWLGRYRREAVQPGTAGEHFALPAIIKRTAIALGAVEITDDEMDGKIEGRACMQCMILCREQGTRFCCGECEEKWYSEAEADGDVPSREDIWPTGMER